ncbi:MULTISPECIES: aminopeptidase P family protein [unclassified Oceanispirochaeta]|uniref:aminopeptidase P family protein n=1 Tax=unclassified Oceanispirochaeta TaxID=2635722 RepID=UPI000E08DC62|nr:MULTISPECIES: aminopeptidase P family protein [unclassified Oceanispirochaeta]MBF9015008.1 aminopeptidase P N-terminal domain-containing protein [Oceanispirochaeta sp. M2]NPD71311.1 M24 family metallopeptidase [Oceanispirochaeta sp. M1]RDG33277.1 M24 family metallopeptidase [Oceanispirochaeta sp. M1]
MFQPNTYALRRETLKKKVRSGLILLLGNEESSMNFGDNTYPFRQDSSFLYFFGLNQAGLTGIIDVDEDREFLFGDDLTIDHIVWMGIQPTVKERAQRAGVTNTGNNQALHDLLKKARSQNRQIHFLPPYRPENSLKLWRWLGIDPDNIKDSASLELIKAVILQREVKTEEELAEIETAVNTSVDMHVAAMNMVSPGISEALVAARVQEIAVAAGGRLSFPAIATVHGETLHNHYHGNELKEGQLFLLDSGAESAMGYAGDLSSTIPVGSTFSQRQSEIYDISLASHEAAISALKPGIPFKDIYYESARTIVNGLKDLGLMKGDTEEALIQGAHALFFPCGLGHQMGLDVHDMEDLGEEYVGYDGQPKSRQFGLKSLRLAKELKPGFVLTIEPGIYFIPTLIDLWKTENKFSDYINYDRVETYKEFGGIRNEENFVITDNGARLLGKQKPKTREDVEAEKGL